MKHPQRAFKPRYSGHLSKEFWDRVGRLPDESHDAVYGLGFGAATAFST